MDLIILSGQDKGEIVMYSKLNSNRRKGFTLVEVIITLALIGIVISLGTTMLIYSIRSHKVVDEEFQIQSNIRLASQIIGNYIRESSAIFMLNDAYFDNSNLKNEWDYFALSSDKTKVVQYKWDTSSNSHVENVLADSYSGLIYSLSFDKSNDESLLGGFRLIAVSDSGSVKANVYNELNSLNSVVVDNSGNASNPAVALAYRTEDIPDPSKPRISVTLVLDKSGSMAWNLDGDTITNGFDNPNSRFAIMKERTVDLLNELEGIGNVHIAVVPFDTNANKSGNYHNLYRAKEDKAILEGLVTGIAKNGGGTNIGDGMRRAYHIHDSFKTSNTGNLLHYNIMLMDGNPTYWTERYSSYYYENLNTGSNNISVRGTGQEDTSNINNSMNYVSAVGENMYVLGSVQIKTFVIGFSANPANINRLNNIAGYVTSPSNSNIVGQYYEAASSEALQEVYRDISKKIEMDAWHIFGPYN